MAFRPMNQKTAVRLVSEHARVTLEIKECKAIIGENLSQCRGIDGHRLDEDERGIPTDLAQRDQHTHLSVWYGRGEPGEEPRYYTVTEDDADECPHCYAAHNAIQLRRGLRRSLGAIRAAMTRAARVES